MATAPSTSSPGSPGNGYTLGFPILEKRLALLELLARQQVVVVAGDTGSGKSTQLPLICLDAGLHASRNQANQPGQSDPADDGAGNGPCGGENNTSGGYDAVHRSITAGLIANVAMREECGSYRATRNRTVRRFPGSVRFRKRPPPGYQQSALIAALLLISSH